MKEQGLVKSIFSLTLCSLAVSLITALSCFAQTGQSNPKTIDPPDTKPGASITRARRQAAAARARAPKTRRRRDSPGSDVRLPTPSGANDATTEEEIGVTVMRLRPATDRDSDSAKELRNKRESVFARVEDDMALSPEDEIRISIEPSFGGYLYVIDRELYDDGSVGRPLLIFPTLLTYGGDNYVEPGEPRVIPDPYGELMLIPNNSSGKSQIAERLTIIISPTRLRLPRPLGEDEMELPSTLVEKWERDWGQKAVRSGVPATVNQGQTIRERAAGRARAKELRYKNRTSALNERDPLPQNVYQLKVDPRAPSLIIMPLRLKGVAAVPSQ